MRLLSLENGKLRITADVDPPAKYAILSHRWLDEDQEISYRDIVSGKAEEAGFSKRGWQKLDFCLSQAAEDGINSVWIDSCCINREDKHEVGKSINMMYEYYKKATVCYVYLSDVSGTSWRADLALSQWFTRGWTLQELVAPSDLRFYSHDRQHLGDKDSLSRELFSITGIDVRTPIQDVPIHRRFEWAKSRTTKEPEDISYCLLGILEVSIAANYGEGAVQARERLLDAVELEHGRKVMRHLRGMNDSTETGNYVTIAELWILFQFQSMNARKATIADPFRHTCHWLLRQPDYKGWMNLETKFIWIKGKPGAGKSTLMKFAHESGRKDCARISFHFNARGDDLEKSVVGMYRTLLHQLLARAPSSREPVRHFFQEEKDCTGRMSLGVTTLKAAFATAVRNMNETVQCFIDALDECKDSDVQDMISFFEDISYGSPLHVCFASRYYPTLTIKSTELLLERQVEQGQDLMDYVYGRLDAGEDLKEQVVKKANGIFFWAVLVVRLLNAEISAGRMYNIRKRLDELPSELHELLRAITAPSDHTDELQLALQWVLYAKRPLSPSEYYLGIMIGLHTRNLTADDPFDIWPRLYPGLEVIKKFVASSSRGLAELTHANKPTVQFIHESVRDFLLHHGGLRDVLRSTDASSAERINDQLKSICFLYMTSTPLSALTNRSLDTEWMYPFLEYAVIATLHHAEASGNVESQADFLRTFTTRPENWQSAFFRSFRKLSGLRTIDEIYLITEDSHIEIDDKVLPFHLNRKSLIELLAYKGYKSLILAAHKCELNVRLTRFKPFYETSDEDEREKIEAILHRCGFLRFITLPRLKTLDAYDEADPVVRAIQAGTLYIPSHADEPTEPASVSLSAQEPSQLLGTKQKHDTHSWLRRIFRLSK